MKIKIGPIEVEQDAIKDEVLYNEYKQSPKDVEKYLNVKSKVLDLTMKNVIAGKTMKMIFEFVFSIIGSVVFGAWSIFVFYTSKDAFVWKEMNLQTAFSVLLQALLIIFICFLPVILLGGFYKLYTFFAARNKVKKDEQETKKPEEN